MFNIVLYQPLIPHNTGNIIRLCTNIGAKLHLIEPLGFDLDDKNLKRAALDYSVMDNIQTYSSFLDYIDNHDIYRIFATTTSASQIYTEINYKIGDTLLFGPEDSGLPNKIKNMIPNTIKIPMQPNNRSLNLSNAAAIVSYEAWRQLQFLTNQTFNKEI